MKDSNVYGYNDYVKIGEITPNEWIDKYESEMGYISVSEDYYKNWNINITSKSVVEIDRSKPTNFTFKFEDKSVLKANFTANNEHKGFVRTADTENTQLIVSKFKESVGKKVHVYLTNPK